MASLLRGLPPYQESSEANSSEDSHIGERQTTPLFVPRERLPNHIANYLEDDSVKILLRSVSVLDNWLGENDGKLEDEVRVRRVKRWRKEALEQLRLELNLSRE